jgi:hypothetical protein
MADKDKDGIPDNIDIDGGTGTGKAAAGTGLPSDIAAIINSIMATGDGSGTKSPQSGTNTSTKKTKLTYNTALAIMKLAAENAGYTAKFTSADVNQFMVEFDAEQARQIEKVVTSTASKLTPGATASAIDKTISSTATTEYPSFFNPGQFTADWVWKKVDFNNETTLGAKSLGILAQVRGLADKFNLFGVADKDLKVAAKEIAMGKMTLADYNVTLQKVAIKEYPQFADRFAKDPELTTYDIASPIVKMLAKTWDMPEANIDWKTNPLVMSYTNYAGPDGKGTPPSYYDLLLKAKKDPKYQLTQQANEDARDAATGLARAFGFGV